MPFNLRFLRRRNSVRQSAGTTATTNTTTRTVDAEDVMAVPTPESNNYNSNFNSNPMPTSSCKPAVVLQAQDFRLACLDPRNTECAVCAEDFQINDIITMLPCEHYFCQPCMQQWFYKQCNVDVKNTSNNTNTNTTMQVLVNSTCPLCRFDCSERSSSSSSCHSTSVLPTLGSISDNDNNEDDLDSDSVSSTASSSSSSPSPSPYYSRQVPNSHPIMAFSMPMDSEHTSHATATMTATTTTHDMARLNLGRNFDLILQKTLQAKRARRAMELHERQKQQQQRQQMENNEKK